MNTLTSLASFQARTQLTAPIEKTARFWLLRLQATSTFQNTLPQLAPLLLCSGCVIHDHTSDQDLAQDPRPAIGGVNLQTEGLWHMGKQQCESRAEKEQSVGRLLHYGQHSLNGLDVKLI